MLTLSLLTASDNAYILDKLSNDPTDEEVTTAVRELLSRMVKEPNLVKDVANQVYRVLNTRRSSEIRQEAIKAGQCYIFAKLDRSATPLHPVYVQVKVYARDFSSFCKANGLSEKEMLRVAHGEVDSSKGWRQGQFPGSLGISRAKVIERNRPGPPMVSGPFFVSSPTIGRNWDAPAAPVFRPVKVYTPAD